MEISMDELRSLLAGGRQPLPDKNYGRAVVILRNGFVFVGDTKRTDGVGTLRGHQVRYWAQRPNGLPGFASNGPIEGDKLDVIEGELEFPWNETNVIGVLPCGPTWNKRS